MSMIVGQICDKYLGSVEAALNTYSLVYPRCRSSSDFCRFFALFSCFLSMRFVSNALKADADTLEALVAPSPCVCAAPLSTLPTLLPHPLAFACCSSFAVCGRPSLAPRCRWSRGRRQTGIASGRGRGRGESRVVAKPDAHAHVAGAQHGKQRRDCGNRRHLQEDLTVSACRTLSSFELSVG